MSVESPWHSARCNQQVVHYDQTSVANCYRTTMNSFSGRFGFVLALKCCNDTDVLKFGKVASRSVSVESPWHGARCNRQIIHYEQSSVVNCHHVCKHVLI